MKRIICALLTVVMLAAMIPAFAVMSSATDENVYLRKLNITHSQEECTGTAATVDWSAIWKPNYDGNKSGSGSKCEANTAVVGIFDKPTTVCRIDLAQSTVYPQRTNGMKVLLLNSKTGEWETVVTVDAAASKVAGTVYTFDNLPTGDNLYSKIKVLRESAYYHNLLWVGAYSSEAQETVGRLNVKPHSMSVNKHEATEDVRDWSKIWNVGNPRTMVKSSDPIWIIGEFDVPTYVTNVILRNGKYDKMMLNTKISFSNDLEHWVDAATITKGDNSMSYSFNSIEVSTAEKYKYVKVWKDTYDATYGDDKISCVCFDIHWISFYNHPTANETFEKVYHVSQQSSVATDLSILWNPDNNVPMQWGSNSVGSVKITGEFATPTVAEKIIIKHQPGAAARNDKTSVEMSVDGVNWKEIGKLQAHQAVTIDYSIIEVSDNTAYKYIRVKQGNNWTYGLMSIAVVGTPTAPEANTTEADFYGVQTKVDADAWALRLISTVDSLDFKAVGYEITVTGVDKDGAAVNKFFDKYTQTVYSSVVDNIGTRNAKALGGNYIFTATINGISIEKYGELTFEIKPYVADAKGQKTYGATQTYTFVDGVAK